MGWCAGTKIFDRVAEKVLSCSSNKEVLEELVLVLEEFDWDCHSESEFINHTLVSGIFHKLHPDWEEL
jgi:hypothetical protein